ncbi:MAG: cob(I)yrinic acid a,c-diamide adenosyltransferase [Prevotella sp.]|nr:cob(I)yrinic acid a,c-diamide adenosyltransferase [Prevotella sp.]MBQ9561349.1 cob(I)yrinic acid a,c-diamide adenosyltransferase [Prevotella sp.]
MKLTKIYTKTGDAGETSLVGGIRVSKDSARIEAYGTLDELSSHLGLLVAMLRADGTHSEEFAPVIEMLQRIQNDIFDISSMLATDAEALSKSSAAWVAPYLENMEQAAKRIESEETPLLEQLIDKMNSQMEPLNSFILPGGSVAAAQCHVCRAVCRRAERRVVSIKVNVNVQKYLNRLSDYLFVLARKINIICRQEEKKWENPCT